MLQASIKIRKRMAGGHFLQNYDTQFFGMIFLFMVLGVTIWSGWSVLLWMKDVRRQPPLKLEVEGEHFYTTQKDIREVFLELCTSGTFIELDVEAIQKQIYRLPWIKKVSVRKQWPDRIKIHLVEYIPVACWNDLNKVDSDGVSFSEPLDWIENQSFPLLYGPEGREKEVLEGYRVMNSILLPRNYRLKSVVMSARHSWFLILDNNICLKLGREYCTDRLHRFIELYPFLKRQGQATNKRVSYIDLRYESGASVAWAPLS